MDKTIATQLLEALAIEASAELTGNILPYWMNTMVDEENGGFYGRRDGYDELIKNAEKGIILNTRILWTFSHAASIVKDQKEIAAYLRIADRAYHYICKYFIDAENGGLYWMVNSEGTPTDTKKQIYAQAFGVYAFSEYYLATKNQQALHQAIGLFDLIEKHSFDQIAGGYFEAFDKVWAPMEDLRLSAKDINECKTMNTHLHILEAYTNLLRCWKNEKLEKQLIKLILLFDSTIINKHYHLQLFFDEHWRVKSNIISFGHDIEASWLLVEAARETNDSQLIKLTQELAIKITDGVIDEGLNEAGALMNEIHDSVTDTDLHWWPQAEGLVGFFEAFQITNNPQYLNRVVTLWQYIKSHVVDRQNGEWHWRLTEKNTLVRSEDKAGTWKCPYHNGRACMELMKRSTSGKTT
jgi:cellobiose epimerase